MEHEQCAGDQFSLWFAFPQCVITIIVTNVIPGVLIKLRASDIHQYFLPRLTGHTNINDMDMFN